MQNLFSLLIVLVFSLAGIFMSDAFRNLKEMIVPLLVLVMLSMGITLSMEDFKRILQKPVMVMYGALLHYGVMPLLAIILSLIFGISRDLYIGMVLVGSVPSGTASNLITYLAKGDLLYSVSITAFSTLLAPLFTPLWTYALAGKYVHVPFWDMVWDVLKIVILPVVLGVGIREIFPRVRTIEGFLPYISVSVVGFIIAVVLSLNVENLKKMDLMLLLAVFLHNVLGFLLGFLFGRLFGLDNKLSKTLSIEVGIQNSGLAVALAIKYFSPLASLPPALFSFLQNVNGIIVSSIYKRIH
ncbi:bile acid:sodium symporter family protein [Hydrogenobacter hydrogenophilus]|uniref:Bile acid:Na+ symporter, BASS family n=1 Tax=Hydrogenobacter hydrogenophilus TaxID=35835 RepID=A0A285NY12_9AQUI|nr:bile acid:sodium symporter family protein [Hydrogenobacter hydrogenophilus]SNZ14365.1 bile acid:Na+ symporter, BASS family [Hydrogenobacter hydrogenophilus]